MLPTGDPLGTVVTMLATPSVVLTVWLSILPALAVSSTLTTTRIRRHRQRRSSVAFQFVFVHGQEVSVLNRVSMGENRGATLSRYSHCGCGRRWH